jgi:hypothetical protein
MTVQRPWLLLLVLAAVAIGLLLQHETPPRPNSAKQPTGACAKIGFRPGAACDYALSLEARSCLTAAGCARAEATVQKLALVCKDEAACSAAMQWLSCVTEASCKEADVRLDQLARACETKNSCAAAAAGLQR